ncbi:MAG: hypothetical protein QM488_05985 [Rhizobiaceae bacterium]
MASIGPHAEVFTKDNPMPSVGASAIRRFLRPVCYQNVPAVCFAS